MFDPKTELLSAVLTTTAVEAAMEGAGDAPWAAAREAIAATRDVEPELIRLVEARDFVALRAIAEAWRAGKRPLPSEDREVLKRALKAFRKSLKVTQLADESSIAGGPMSSGRPSGILGMRPPERYGRAVWDALVHQKELRYHGHGLYELPPGRD
jgi:hypothetical protein